jgi:hypothetical protein
MLALVAFMVACSQFEAPGPDDVNLESSEELAALGGLSGMWNARLADCDGPTVAPITDLTGPGGNVECSQAGEYEFSSGRVNLEEGEFSNEGNWPEGFTIHTDGTFVSWEFTPFMKDGVLQCLKDLSVIVKGGAAANVYTYSNGETSDCNLVSPNNASGGPAGLSNLTLCYNLEPCEVDECWEDETAWARGNRFVQRGNWAMFFDGPTQAAIDATAIGEIIPLPKIGGGTSLTKTLLAGQTLQAGTFKLVKTSDPNVFKAVIIINQFQGVNGIVWRFNPNESENVKVQDYASTPPARNPAPGLFAHKFFAPNKGENRIDFFLPRNNFYAVHVDMERQVECPVED